MKAAALLDLHRRLTADAAALLERKAHDYASSTEDALATMKSCGLFGIPPTTGALLRMLDKLGRLSALGAKDPKVVGESVRDTVLDLINYAVLWYALREDGGVNQVVVEQAPQQPRSAETLSETAYLEAYHDWCLGRFGAAPSLKPETRERVLTQLHAAVKAAQSAPNPAASLEAFMGALTATGQNWGDQVELAALYNLLAYRGLVPDAPRPNTRPPKLPT